MNTKLFPLALLAACDKESIEGITRFQKLVFIAQRELFNEDQFYSYVPHKYGPFSKSLYDDLDELVDRGFIDQSTEDTVTGDKKKIYTLGAKGERAVRRATENQIDVDLEAIEAIKQEHNDENLWDFLDYVYSEYPEMTTESKLKL